MSENIEPTTDTTTELARLQRELAVALAQIATLREQADAYRQGEARLLARIDRLEHGPIVREVSA